MKYELKTISTKRFLIVTLLIAPVIMAISIGFAILTGTKLFLFILIPLIGLTIYLGQKYSQLKTEIDLGSSEFIKINDHEIPYKDIIGYFINETGLTQSELSLRLKSNISVHIVSSNVGRQGKLFKDFLECVIMKLNENVSDLKILDYQDIYVKQMRTLKPILIIFTGLVLIIDIIALYFFISKKMQLNWKFLLVNFSLIGLIPYMKKKKNN